MMDRRSVGVAFCFISAFLFATRYISAAIFGSNVISWDEGIFSAMLTSIGSSLTTLSIISLIIGIIYLVMAERK